MSLVSLSPRLFYILKLTLSLLTILLLTTYLFSSSLPSTPPLKTFSLPTNANKKATFIKNVLENEIDGPFDNSSLIELCRETKWVPGLIFRCEDVKGGVVNVRNVVLNCVRYTILAGATGLVLPQLLPRPNQKSTPVLLTHLFSLPSFTSTLTTICPAITIHDHINNLYNLPSTSSSNSLSLSPSSLSSPSSPLLHHAILSNPRNWTTEFKSWLNTTHPTPFTSQKPLLINLKSPLLEFPLSYDKPAFVSNLGRILPFRDDVRRLAAAVLYALSQKHNLDLDFNLDSSSQPRSQSSPQKDQENENEKGKGRGRGGGIIQAHKFLGIQLRTGPDAVAAGWTSSAIQSTNYLSLSSSLSLPLLYLSSSQSSLSFSSPTQSFSLSSPQNTTHPLPTPLEIIIETSTSLLSTTKAFSKEYKQLQSLTWDQRLLVDYEVLLWSSVFAGPWESSFAWGVAMRRHSSFSFRFGSETGWGAELQGRSVGKREREVGMGREEEKVPRAAELDEEKKKEGIGRLPHPSPSIPPTDIEIGLYTQAEEKRRKEPMSESQRMRRKEAGVGDVCWEDWVGGVRGGVEGKDGKDVGGNGGKGIGIGSGSVIFGPEGEGGRVRGSLWP
ncbi:hypothetical protein EG329_002924 [Mollisiaceae sp. DMI_Dod_QoI]|nr:hypothetical protein EG329_002924 [Helotiales sp. DMI_Dod_QoI]